ncbi:EamA family transporter [Acuticoccus sp. M5D2P5]|uniref:EamA family transporter n=1 Tax=Acuticoccus kalidii TaxID=2910977 RepID=UPI001F18A6B7|nr:EamA family transporter [Acuticoccus kalidii]MCF3935663.1 EamA family transporter [Acuticoccus kalidii]
MDTAPLDTLTYLAVLAAALMHAGWNAVVKVGDRFSAILMLSLAQGAIAFALLAVFPFPAREAWGWLVLSAALHVGYRLFLIRAYAHGDLAEVYPLARGTAPLIVALVGALFLGERLAPLGLLAVAAIGLGVIAMSLRGGKDHGPPHPAAIAFALGTAVFTASYTLTDAVGARLAATASGYTMALFALDSVMMTGFAAATRGRAAFTRLAPIWRTGLLAGALSLGSYWVAIWAFTRAPVALVAALRETSVLFALLIGVLFLGEHVGRWRILAAILILSGMMLMRA